MRLVLIWSASVLAAVCSIGGAAVVGSEPARFDLSKFRLGSGSQLAASPAQILGSCQYLQAGTPKLRVNQEKERGAAADVYGRVAPATVLIKAQIGGKTSWGSGWIVDPEGWIITNNHVVAEADIDPNTGARAVAIYRGRIEDDFMHLIEQPSQATIYKTDKDRDLALLRIARLPTDKDKLPVIEFAKQPPKPGSDCVVIGHPAAGTLWTVRSGEILGMANFPNDLMNAVTARLESPAKGSDHGGVQKSFSAAPQWKVLLTNCNVNHGDSGGPLLNANGELIGVTMGMPSSQAAAGSSSVLSYHVHLDEVKSFMAVKPQEPVAETPDPWPPGLYSKLLDEDGDGTPDTLAFSTTDGGPLCGVLLDLSQATAAALSKAELADAAAKHTWKFQFALATKPALRAFYDSGYSGQIDLILTGREADMTATDGLRLENGKWSSFKPKQQQKLIDPALLNNVAERARFAKITNRLFGAGQ
ncbi:MAG TPA: serine protease [Pirellulales bacterium]|nr:serine protease [Pirellulales bacterium]